MTKEELEMRTLVRESDVIDRTDGSELAKAFNHLWDKYVEQEPCEMTAEEYRQRMIQAFHNADTDELIAVCVLPTENEFEHLEWLLKNHYKKEPYEDAISRQAVLDAMYKLCDTGETLKENPWRDNLHIDVITDAINDLPSVTPQPKTGHWIEVETNMYTCSNCGHCFSIVPKDNSIKQYKYCPNCKYSMVAPQGSEENE